MKDVSTILGPSWSLTHSGIAAPQSQASYSKKITCHMSIKTTY